MLLQMLQDRLLCPRSRKKKTASKNVKYANGRPTCQRVRGRLLRAALVRLRPRLPTKVAQQTKC